jgi:hypothetical protein
MEVVADARWRVTDKGYDALGPEVERPTPWIDRGRISVALARDVSDLVNLTDLSPSQRSQIAGRARWREVRTAPQNGKIPFNKRAGDNRLNDDGEVERQAG